MNFKFILSQHNQVNKTNVLHTYFFVQSGRISIMWTQLSPAECGCNSVHDWLGRERHRCFLYSFTFY